MLCAKFGWNWPSGSEEEDENCKLFTFSSSSSEPLGQFQPNLAQASLGEGDSSLFKWRALPFQRGDNYEIAKIPWRI